MAKPEQDRLAGRSHPLPVFPRLTQVKVYMGAGWQKGSVEQSDRDGCTVYLSQLRRTTRVRDARNLIRL